MHFTNTTHLDCRSVRKLAAAIARERLDPPQYKNFVCDVQYRHRHGLLGTSFSYWPNRGRVIINIPDDYDPSKNPLELAETIAAAIKKTYNTMAATMRRSLQEIVDDNPVFISAPRPLPEPPAPHEEVRKHLNYEATRLGKKLSVAENEVRTITSRMKARATRIKRAETQQKKDARKLKYLADKVANATAAHELAAAEAALQREADAERETEKYTRR